MTDSDGQPRGKRQARWAFRLTPDEHRKASDLQKRLQASADKYTTITQKRLFLEALDALELRLNDLERKRKKP